MSQSRDSIYKQPTIDIDSFSVPDADEVGKHLDRLYEKYYELWDLIEVIDSKLEKLVAFYPSTPLPLKYK